MSALGQKQTCAAHKPMSAKCHSGHSRDYSYKQNDRLAAVIRNPVAFYLVVLITFVEEEHHYDGNYYKRH